MQTRVGAIRGPAQLGDWWGEAECCRRLILEEPANGMHWSNLANALWIHDDLPRALAAARRASGLIPQHPLVWRCLGNVLADLGQFDQSMTSYTSSLRLQASAETSFNASKVLMGLGRWEEAYAVSEERFAQSGFTTYRTGPFWQGWEGARCLWLWGEQGFGDVVQHLRWLVPLLRRGVAVTLELEPALVRLAAEGLAWVGGALEVRAADTDPSPLPRDTCRGSLLSLPHRLGCAPLTTNTPYLRLPDCGSAGRQLLRKVPRIGIVWLQVSFWIGTCWSGTTCAKA
jgi:tetratricopeptide (TPR) repeat protein